MEFPYLQEVSRYREMTNNFGGYNHQLTCQEGQFYDMKNMTSQHYPILSPRGKRGIVSGGIGEVTSIINKNGIMWIEKGKLGYIIKKADGTYTKGYQDIPTLSSTGEITMISMGAYVVVLPDNVWINTSTEPPFEYGNMGAKKTITGSVSFTLANQYGEAVSWKDESYYKNNAPNNGDYMLSTVNGKTYLKVYSSATSVWSTVATTYIQIKSTGIGKDFKKGDGVTITLKTSDATLKTLFVNEEENGYRSISTVIKEKTDDSIVIVGIIDKAVTLSSSDLVVERKIPELAYVTECNNRLWGCSKDGHEIYCTKLGDVNNWYVYEGISTDSWAVTIGSDGKFTGAITYQGMPMFFKEDCFIKISVSSTGAHQLKETKCRGVQEGSSKSLTIVNETLYYKSAMCIVSTNGALPVSISDALGDVKYFDAVSGSLGNRYYISMRDASGEYSLFVFDQKTGIWSKEDNTKATHFCNFNDDLFFIDGKTNQIKSISGTKLHEELSSEEEKLVSWYAESGNIGYETPDNKYISRVNVRITLEFGTNVDFYLQYDSDGEWIHKFNMSGKGTKTFTVPVIPKRCDHFKYKVVGKGGCKIHSITKTIEQGSDI